MVKLLVTVAHPDDEAFGCGSVLAHAAARGIEAVVACATKGELGELRPGTLTEGAELGAVREGELRAATELLGVARVDVLGWRDSGVDGEPAPGSLVAAAPAEVEAAVAAVIDRERPDVVVTLDASDGHRDHVVIRDATLAAVRAASARPERTYLWCLPRSLLAPFVGVPDAGTPDQSITTEVDTSRYVDRRWVAMRAHATQACPYDAMDDAMRTAFLATDRLVRVEPRWDGGPVERDWWP